MNSLLHLLNDIDTHLGEQIAVQRERLSGASQSFAAHVAACGLSDLESLRLRVRDAIADMKEGT